VPTGSLIFKRVTHTATMLLRNACDVNVSTSMLRQVFVQLTCLAHVTVRYLQWVCIQCLVLLKTPTTCTCHDC
jgi:hypothetical protein